MTDCLAVAERGVVFFRGQTELDDALHKELIFRLGQLTGRPAENGLYKHPLWKIVGDKDPHCPALDNGRFISMYRDSPDGEKVQSIRIAWHSDISFEPNPMDFSSLRLTQLPAEGGGRTPRHALPLSSSALRSHRPKRPTKDRTDTLWASGYEIYDRFSKPFQSFLDGLTAKYSLAKQIHEKARSVGQSVDEGPRGAPANVGTALEANHPVIRTHPLTGWKSVYAMGLHCRKINGLSPSESEFLLGKILSMVTENHDLQVRFRWQNPSDIGMLLFPRLRLHDYCSLPRSITPKLPPDFLSRNDPFSRRAGRLTRLVQRFGIIDVFITRQRRITEDLAAATVYLEWAKCRTWIRTVSRRQRD